AVWKEKDLGTWNPFFPPHQQAYLNKNLQIVAGHYLYQNAHLVDLSTQVPAGCTNIRALGINEAGFIVGQANISTGSTTLPNHAVILIPIAITEVISDQIPGNEANKLP